MREREIKTDRIYSFIQRFLWIFCFFFFCLDLLFLLLLLLLLLRGFMAMEALRSPSFPIASLTSSGILTRHSCWTHPLSNGRRRTLSASPPHHIFSFRKKISSSSWTRRGLRCSIPNPNDEGSKKTSWDGEDANYIEAHVVEAGMVVFRSSIYMKYVLLELGWSWSWP